MAGFPTIDGIASALSLLLAALASLRAASRLERRMCNDGSIGLMDGPPILGPAKMRRNSVAVPAIDGLPEDPASLSDDDADRIKGEDEEDDGEPSEVSPLWEHTEAFRRAVILGLLFEEDEHGFDNGLCGTLFSDVTRNEEGDRIEVRGGSSEEDMAIAAAVEAGLLAPGAGGTRRVRGGGARTKRKQQQRNDGDNPLVAMTSWLMRELSAPLAAVPAWHGLLCSHLRQKKENRLRESEWCLLTPWERLRFSLTGRSSGRMYDPAGLDFDAYASAKVKIPSCDVGAGSSSPVARTARVKAFAPRTFRDLRNNCFRMTESEYARSILNAMGGAISMDKGREYGAGIPMTTEETSSPDDDSTISEILEGILGGDDPKRGRIRRNGIETLPYVSFQSNSKGAARAGTFFFFTADGAFMIKTVKKEEARAFLEMLPEYHRFMSDNVNGRNSLLTRIFGMYSVRFPAEADGDGDSRRSGEGDGRWEGGLFSPGWDHASSSNSDGEERSYLVMHSVFPSDASSFVTERFDLKGSTIGRECSLEERRTRGANAVLKDLDLKREVTEELNEAGEGVPVGKNRGEGSRYGICIGKRRKTALMAQLERDVDLLQRCNVLDYSLLVGVADMERSIDATDSKASPKSVPKCVQNFFRWMDSPMPYYGAGTTKVDGGALSAIEGSRRGRQVTYYMGVIDFLQPWTVKKRLERDLKGLAGMDKTAISCVAPADYARRFLDFADSHVT